MNKGCKFLTKLWCCVGGGVLQDNLVLSTGLDRGIVGYAINHTQPTIPRFAPTKGKRSKRQLSNLFASANSHYQPINKQ